MATSAPHNHNAFLLTARQTLKRLGVELIATFVALAHASEHAVQRRAVTTARTAAEAGALVSAIDANLGVRATRTALLGTLVSRAQASKLGSMLPLIFASLERARAPT